MCWGQYHPVSEYKYCCQWRPKQTNKQKTQFRYSFWRWTVFCVEFFIWQTHLLARMILRQLIMYLDNKLIDNSFFFLNSFTNLYWIREECKLVFFWCVENHFVKLHRKKLIFCFSLFFRNSALIFGGWITRPIERYLNKISTISLLIACARCRQR